MKERRILKFVNELHSQLAEETWVDHRKDGDTNIHEDGTRQKLASLYPVAAGDGEQEEGLRTAAGQSVVGLKL